MRIIICYILLAFSISVFAQTSEFKLIYDRESVAKLHFDPDRLEIHFETTGGKAIKFDGQNFKATDFSFEERNKVDFSFDANALTFDSSTVVLPHTITCAERSKSEFFIGTEDGLYHTKIPLGLVAEKFYRSDLEQLNAINSICRIKEYFFINDSIRLMTCDLLRDKYTVDEFKFGLIKDVFINTYGQVFLATESGLVTGNIDHSSNQNAPVLLVEEIGFEKHRNNFQIDSGEMLIYSVETRHPFESENLEIFAQLKGNKLERKIEIVSNPFIIDKLNPGDYELRFHSRIKGGTEAQFSERIFFEINAAKSNAIWWYLFGGIGLLFLVYGLGNFKNQQFNKEIVTQRDKLLLENKALRYEQQALQLQMNPHFIFNVLNSINGMIAMKDNENARKYINEFSQLMRSVLNQSRSANITLEDEINYLNKYISLERVTRNSSFEFELTHDDSLNLESQTLPMIIQPFVENAIIHGFKGLKQTGKLSVDFSRDGDHLLVKVEDNGVGRNANAVKEEHQSVGLTVVNDRLNKGFGYTFDDLKDAEGNSKGTRVEIKMPLND